MKHYRIHHSTWLLSFLLILTFLFTGCRKANTVPENEPQGQSEISSQSTTDNTNDTSTQNDTSDKATTSVMIGNETYPNFMSDNTIQAEAIANAKVSKLDTVYNMDYQQAVTSVIERYQADGEYTIQNPLMILNPYGTNTTGLYVYFKTKVPTSVEYTISVDSDQIPDFTRVLYTNQAGEAVTEQEGLLIGLIPGISNHVTLTAYDVNGTKVEASEFTVNVENFQTVKEIVLEQGSASNPKELTEGLFVLFGYDRRNSKEPRHLLFYDNYGVIRCEIPLDIKYADFRIENVDGYLLFPCADNRFVLMSDTGEIMAIYEATGYMFHHDFSYDASTNKVLVLANNLSKETKEDIVLTLDLNTGTWSETLDFEKLLPNAYQRAILPEGDKKLDWIHLNTIVHVNSNDVIVSSRELSTIIRVNDIYGTPKVAYLIAEPSIWDGTGYENLLLKKVGEFSDTGGQHTVMYLPDESLKKGQYYLYMFNNNYGVSDTLPDYDWKTIPGIGIPKSKPEGSYYYKYLVDDNAKTYELVESFLVPYSRIVASAQHYGNHIIVCSGVAGVYGEYDAKGNLISEYKMQVDEFVYRVMKYSMNQYWFNPSISTTEGVRDTKKEFVQGVISNESSNTSEFDAFEDYSNATSNIKGNDYTNFE